jgi:hypothetical protein
MPVIGERLLAYGGARLVGALALACLVMGLLLAASVAANWHQFRGHARVTTALAAQLAAAEARGQAEIEACAATNQRVTGTVRVLEQELQNCRGQTQRIEARMALALRQRDRARSEVRDHERMRALQVEAIARDHEECARPVCRSLSDRLLGIAPER